MNSELQASPAKIQGHLRGGLLSAINISRCYTESLLAAQGFHFSLCLMLQVGVF